MFIFFGYSPMHVESSRINAKSKPFVKRDQKEQPGDPKKKPDLIPHKGDGGTPASGQKPELPKSLEASLRPEVPKVQPEPLKPASLPKDIPKPNSDNQKLNLPSKGPSEPNKGPKVPERPNLPDLPKFSPLSPKRSESPKTPDSPKLQEIPKVVPKIPEPTSFSPKTPDLPKIPTEPFKMSPKTPESPKDVNLPKNSKIADSVPNFTPARRPESVMPNFPASGKNPVPPTSQEFPLPPYLPGVPGNQKPGMERGDELFGLGKNQNAKSPSKPFGDLRDLSYSKSEFPENNPPVEQSAKKIGDALSQKVPKYSEVSNPDSLESSDVDEDDEDDEVDEEDED